MPNHYTRVFAENDCKTHIVRNLGTISTRLFDNKNVLFYKHEAIIKYYVNPVFLVTEADSNGRVFASFKNNIKANITNYTLKYQIKI